MAIFSYRAVRSDGQRINGMIEAASAPEAKRLIRDQQLIILSFAEATPTKTKAIKMTFEQGVIFTTQLSQLLEASVPLYESLEALEEQAKGDSTQAVISSLREHIKKGGSLSSALALYPDTFPPLYRAIITAGESVGHLDQALIRLSQLLTAQRQAKQRLISALLYPCILLVLLFAAMGVMVFFVIPAIEGLFEGKELPTFSVIVLSIAHFIHNHIVAIIVTATTTALSSLYYLSKSANRQKVLSKMLSWPIIGSFLLKSALGRFSRTLSNLLSGGTTLSNALPYAKEALSNKPLEEVFDEALQNIINGQTFSSTLHRSHIIPPLFSRMVAIGEETGRLAPILGNLAQIYEEDSDRTLERAVSMLQPLLLILMGGVIGTTLLAILLPLANFGSSMEF